MKNLAKLLLVALLSVTFFSCSDDDDYSVGDLKGLYQGKELVNLVTKTNSKENDEKLKEVFEEGMKNEQLEYLTDSKIYFDGKGNCISYEYDSYDETWDVDYFSYYFKGNKLYLVDEDGYEAGLDVVVASGTLRIKYNLLEEYETFGTIDASTIKEFSIWGVYNKISENMLD